MARASRFQKLTLATAACTIVLFSVGGLVRGTGSGLGCVTWPNCFPGQLFPEGTVHSLIEFSHRFLVFVSTILVFVTAFFAWRGYREIRSIVWPALAAIPLVLGQAVLGGIVVKTDLNPWWVTIHFAVALAFVADVTYLAANSFLRTGATRTGATRTGATRTATRGDGFARLSLLTVGATAVLLLVGTYVRAKGAGLAFTDWPLMDGKLVPALGGADTAMFLHRILAALVFLLVLFAMIRARTMAQRSKNLVALSTLAVALFVAQILVGAAQVWTRLKPWAVVMHVALSVLVWACLVTLATVASARAAGARATDDDTHAEEARSPSPTSAKDRITAYYRLTKPEIIFLLLVTTVPAMFLAGHGMPPLRLVLATLLGGALAAGSANATNQYLDRDIDEVMRRTRRRPLPSSAVTPDQALRFAFVLGAISFFFLAIAVNVLAAELALAAIAFYVFVYTMWLKRTTTQNIVIGGAAGAVPALVGWAAVTGSLAAPAWILFAIIFVWTPPHFWALALRYQGDYAAAGVPMLPVVRGEDETRRQIFLYSLVLFGTSLVLVPVAHMGMVYLLTALGLGGTFVYRALRLWNTGDPARSWGLFKFSIWYLAALFGAVAVDALLPLSR